MPVGSNQTDQWTIFNNGNTSVNFITYIPSFQASANQMTPNVTLVPDNGFIPAHSSLNINVTVYMPAHNQPGVGYWSGILQIIQQSNQTGGGGSAVIMSGLAKGIDIVSRAPLPPPTTSTVPATSSTGSQSGQSQGALQLGSTAIAGVVIVILIIAAAAYMLASRKKPAKRKGRARARRRARKRASRARAGGRGRSRRPSRRRRRR